MKKALLSIMMATAWISISEFMRNELLFKSIWVNHYEKLGLIFPSSPVNGIVWVIWSLCYAIIIFTVSKRFTIIETTLIAWSAGFIMMWLVIGNLSVLPYGILSYAVPLSFLEAFTATFIIYKINNQRSDSNVKKESKS